MVTKYHCANNSNNQAPDFIVVSQEWLSEKFSVFSNQIDSLKQQLTTLEIGGIEKRYTFEEAMAILDVSDKTLKGYYKKGWIGYTEVGTKKYFKESDIEDFFNRFYIPKKIGS
ncbi:helix-turn-helix domain-containing protein [Pseudocnuella soli]|uniref:helix-turn-helix domain-containing protein n=1 Tax=Pseudocnuella soli TaxID=2502779 RepID=UPI00104E3BC7|nr:helix-turn-helix domain-containing protein [Pseudocnuella soli]